MSHSRSQKIIADGFFLLILGLISFGFLAVFSYTTSPFSTVDNGKDSAFFCLVGRGMIKGYLPYRDFFDMKGPYLFLIEYAGQVLSYGRAGIFTIQCVNLFLILALICKIFTYYQIRNRFYQVCLLLPLLCIMGFTFEGGNLTEEFSLLPLFSCLYLCLVFLNRCNDPGVFWQRRIYWYAAGWFGFCFGLLTLIRITNAALICAMVLTVLLYLLRSRKTKQLLVCAGMFAAGLCAAAAPAVLFFGLRGLLGEMLEAVFVLGFRYSGEKSILQHITETVTAAGNQKLLLLIIPGVVPALLGWRTRKERVLAASGALFTFIAIASGNSYTHYYTLTIPLLVLCELAIAESCRTKVDRRSVLAIGLAAVMLGSQAPLMSTGFQSAYKHLFRQDTYHTQQRVQDIASRIPKEDAQSVFCYGINPFWYTYADLFPCIRYCGWQEHYLSLMPNIYDELKQRFEADPPKWVVLPRQKPELPDFLEKHLADDYEEAYHNKQYTLYHLSLKAPM